MNHTHGYRSSINTEFLAHLNIKSLRSQQHQLAYYRHYYRQNPSLTMSTVDGPGIASSAGAPGSNMGPGMGVGAGAGGGLRVEGGSVTQTMASQRTSSTPSLTSTNDPFETFDSNEILLGLDPFSDTNALNQESRRRAPPPPVPSASMLGVELVQEDRSNSTLLRSFPTPPTPPTEPMSPMSLSSFKSPTARTSAISSFELNDSSNDRAQAHRPLHPPSSSP